MSSWQTTSQYGDWTQGFMNARKALCQLSYTPSQNLRPFDHTFISQNNSLFCYIDYINLFGFTVQDISTKCFGEEYDRWWEISPQNNLACSLGEISSYSVLWSVLRHVFWGEGQVTCIRSIQPQRNRNNIFDSFGYLLQRFSDPLLRTKSLIIAWEQLNISHVQLWCH